MYVNMNMNNNYVMSCAEEISCDDVIPTKIVQIPCERQMNPLPEADQAYHDMIYRNTYTHHIKTSMTYKMDGDYLIT